MDFNAIINKLLKANSESRRRQLREFTCKNTFFFRIDLLWVRYPYVWRGDAQRGVWLYTMGSQHHSHSSRADAVLRGKTNQELGEYRLFPSRSEGNCNNFQKSAEMGEAFRKIKEVSEKDAGELFVTKILPMYVSEPFFPCGRHTESVP